MRYYNSALLLILSALVCQAIPQSRVILRVKNDPSIPTEEDFTETTEGKTVETTTEAFTETTKLETTETTEKAFTETTEKESAETTTEDFTETTGESTELATTEHIPICPSPFKLEGDQCLYFATFAEETQTESRQVCHSVSGELAAIKTASQLQRIIDAIYAKGFAGKNFWIDGSDAAVEGTWLFTTGDRLPGGTPFWMASEITHAPLINATLNCAYLYSGMGYLISDQSCNLKGSPLCEHSVQWEEKDNTIMEQETPAVECPPFYVDVSGLCLAFITWASDTWNEARQTCHGLSGELASINDIEQLRSIYLYLHGEAIAGHSFWLGGSDIALEGTWIWPDGTPVPMGSPWWGNSDGNDLPEPDGGDPEDCLAITTQGFHYFRDKPCNTLLNPLCLIAPGTIIEDHDYINY